MIRFPVAIKDERVKAETGQGQRKLNCNTIGSYLRISEGCDQFWGKVTMFGFKFVEPQWLMFLQRKRRWEPLRVECHKNFHRWRQWVVHDENGSNFDELGPVTLSMPPWIFLNSYTRFPLQAGLSLSCAEGGRDGNEDGDIASLTICGWRSGV